MSVDLEKAYSITFDYNSNNGQNVCELFKIHNKLN